MKRFVTAVLGFAIISFHYSDSEASSHRYDNGYLRLDSVPSTRQDMPYCLGFSVSIQMINGTKSVQDWREMTDEVQIGSTALLYDSTYDDTDMLLGQGAVEAKKCADGIIESKLCLAKAEACVQLSREWYRN